jgi:hypothetical protein
MTSTTLDIVDIALKGLGLVVGAAWTVLTYLRGRTFKRRLEPVILGSIYSSRGAVCLSITAKLKNVGLTKIPITQRGTGIRILTYQAEPGTSGAIDPTHIATLEVFRQHDWIEPGEQIEDSSVYLLPSTAARIQAVHLSLSVVSRTRKSKPDIVWNGDAVIPLADPPKQVISVPDGK